MSGLVRNSTPHLLLWLAMLQVVDRLKADDSEKKDRFNPVTVTVTTDKKNHILILASLL